jgi:predicted lipid-binding transport protein (Tim44 family)
MSLRHKSLILGLATLMALGMAQDGFARAGSGGSFGSRGSSTFSSTPSTSVAPGGGAPISRSMTSPNYNSPNGNVFRPNTYGNTGGFFGGGLGRGLIGGFLGAGLFGLMFGHGFSGGLGGGFSFIGLLLQLGLLFLVFKLVMGFFRNRQAGFAGNGAAFSPGGMFGGGTSGGSPFSGFGGGGGSAPARETLQIQPADFNTFEQRLGEIQAAFGAENYDGLRHTTTPEMASYFAEELAGNTSKGVVNKLGVPRLLKGDLAEAWREPSGEYATVAMHYALTDWMVERNSGRVVSGDPSNPQEVTEVWTFTRPNGGSPVDWKLSAIQQA